MVRPNQLRRLGVRLAAWPTRAGSALNTAMLCGCESHSRS